MARSPEEGASELHNGAGGGTTVRLEQNDSAYLDGGATAGLINRSVRESEAEGTLATEIPTCVYASLRDALTPFLTVCELGFIIFMQH